MNRKQRIAVGIGVVLGLAIAVTIAVWRESDPNDAVVRQAVVTTIQKETPESFLITGTLQITAEAMVDSTSTLTPRWLNEMAEYANADLGAAMTSFASVRDRATVRVPGRVSYGFDVRELTPSMIAVGENQQIMVDLPPLSVRAIEPDLGRLEVRTSNTGAWKRMFVSNPDTLQAQVRKQALERVQQAFREQAESRLQTASQPHINTARAVKKMLRPTLIAVGIPNPSFRIRIGESLVMEPEG